MRWLRVLGWEGVEDVSISSYAGLLTVLVLISDGKIHTTMHFEKCKRGQTGHVTSDKWHAFSIESNQVYNGGGSACWVKVTGSPLLPVTQLSSFPQTHSTTEQVFPWQDGTRVGCGSWGGQRKLHQTRRWGGWCGGGGYYFSRMGLSMKDRDTATVLVGVCLITKGNPLGCTSTCTTLWDRLTATIREEVGVQGYY